MRRRRRLLHTPPLCLSSSTFRPLSIYTHTHTRRNRKLNTDSIRAFFSSHLRVGHGADFSHLQTFFRPCRYGESLFSLSLDYVSGGTTSSQRFRKTRVCRSTKTTFFLAYVRWSYATTTACSSNSPRVVHTHAAVVETAARNRESI